MCMMSKAGNKTDSDNKKRIKWIDLAKGVCIMLVVVTHVFFISGVGLPMDEMLTCVRMPLYFILSGLFFKQYEGFGGFLVRKTNKLLVPFLFFFLVTSVLACWIYYHGNALSIFWYDRKIILNGPIWFLLCLFDVNILFYLIQLFANRFFQKHKVACVLTLSLMCGFLGLFLGYKEIQLPFYIDTALSATPLFAFGWLLFRHTRFLKSAVDYKRDVLLLVICVPILWFLGANCRWVANVFPEGLMWTIYLPSIAGPMIVLILAKMVGYLPLVSYWGRYSIIILCTHFPVALITRFFLRQLSTDNHIILIPVLVITMLVCHALIPVLKRFFPYVTAQKDLFKIKPECNSR